MREHVGRALLAFAIVATPGFQVTADWSYGHIDNPEWPLHAKYHLIVYHLTLIIFSAVALYLCLGRSHGARFRPSLSALAVVGLWLPFYAAALFPQGSPYATTELAQRTVPVQFIVGGVLILLSVAGWLVASRSGTNYSRLERM